MIVLHRFSMTYEGRGSSNALGASFQFPVCSWQFAVAERFLDSLRSLGMTVLGGLGALGGSRHLRLTIGEFRLADIRRLRRFHRWEAAVGMTA
jgi:hypothetical protein